MQKHTNDSDKQISKRSKSLKHIILQQIHFDKARMLVVGKNKAGWQGRWAGWSSVPAATANIFAAATNRTTRQSKADWPGPSAVYHILNNMSMKWLNCTCHGYLGWRDTIWNDTVHSCHITLGGQGKYSHWCCHRDFAANPCRACKEVGRLCLILMQCCGFLHGRHRTSKWALGLHYYEKIMGATALKQVLWRLVNLPFHQPPKNLNYFR